MEQIDIIVEEVDVVFELALEENNKGENVPPAVVYVKVSLYIDGPYGCKFSRRTWW